LTIQGHVRKANPDEVPLLRCLLIQRAIGGPVTIVTGDLCRHRWAVFDAGLPLRPRRGLDRGDCPAGIEKIWLVEQIPDPGHYVEGVGDRKQRRGLQSGLQFTAV